MHKFEQLFILARYSSSFFIAKISAIFSRVEICTVFFVRILYHNGLPSEKEQKASFFSLFSCTIETFFGIKMKKE